MPRRSFPQDMDDRNKYNSHRAAKTMSSCLPKCGKITNLCFLWLSCSRGKVVSGGSSPAARGLGSTERGAWPLRGASPLLLSPEGWSCLREAALQSARESGLYHIQRPGAAFGLGFSFVVWVWLKSRGRSHIPGALQAPSQAQADSPLRPWRGRSQDTDSH